VRCERAPYAADPARSRGRRFSEPPPAQRTEFQRDRDRIVHSTAFRRLVYKTQVFVNHEGDMYRTRLTHSLEVAQIGRSVARALGLDEDLTEAIAIAHDLGHTPFGHAGQDALNACMKEHGGFEHNMQSLRLVDLLEEHYAAFPGLNLTWETREGILKHCSRTNAAQLGDLGKRFLDGGQPGLEAQLANLADEIAYNNHDVDDGLRAGLLTIEQLREVALFRAAYDPVSAAHPGLAERRLVHETIRSMIGSCVTDLIAETRRRIAAAGVADIDAVRAQPEPLVRFSPAMREQTLELKRFLRGALYKHPRVQRMTDEARQVVADLFAGYQAEPQRVPGLAALAPEQRPRALADYIAGMTDRFALAEHARLRRPATS
jgi:dGTPase